MNAVEEERKDEEGRELRKREKRGWMLWKRKDLR